MSRRLTIETADWRPVALYASGKQWREVWETLGIAEPTLRSRVEALHRVAGTSTTRELVAWWKAHVKESGS